jgi:hypothetical protein
MKNGNTLSYRVDCLEKNFEKLDEKIDKIMTNELPHLQESMIQLRTRMTTLTAINIGAIVVAIVITKLFT